MRTYSIIILTVAGDYLAGVVAGSAGAALDAALSLPGAIAASVA